MLSFSPRTITACLSSCLVSVTMAATNQTVTASFQKQGGPAEVILRERNSANHYKIRLGDENLEFVKYENQVEKLLGSRRFPARLQYRDQQRWTIKAVTSGNMISAHVYNHQGIEVTSGTVFDRSFEDGPIRLVEGDVTQWEKPTVQQLPQYETPPGDLDESYDIIIAGAGTAGSMAAIQAARLGSKVLVVEESDWIGGQMAAAAVTSMDEGAEYPPHGVDRNSVRERGLYREFYQRAVHLYGTMGLSTDTCYVTANHFGLEPGTAQALLYEMFQQERVTTGAVLDVTLETSITKVLKSGNRITGVNLQIETDQGALSKTVSSRILIDATEYGDILPLADVPYRVGNWTSDNINLSAPEVPAVQDFTWAAVIRAYPEGSPADLLLTMPPSGYNKADYKRALDNPEPTTSTTPWSWQRFISYRGMPDSDRRNSSVMNPWAAVTKTHMNIGANDAHVDVRAIENLDARMQMEYELKLTTLKLLYYIQNDMTEPVTTWTVALNEGFDTPYNRRQNDRLIARYPDMAPYRNILNQFPPIPYARESRRMIGVHTIRAREIDRRTGPMIFPTSVAVGDYPVDLHGADKPSVIELELDDPEDIGAIGFAGNQVGPFTIPFEAFIPATMDGFLAAEKNISQSRLVNGATRLQPSTMLIGQAAGAIAGLAVTKQVEPRELHPAEVQKVLLDEGNSLYAARYDAHKMPGVALDTDLWKSLQLCILYGIVELKDAHQHLAGLNILSGASGVNGWHVNKHHNLQYSGDGTGLLIAGTTSGRATQTTSSANYSVNAKFARSGGGGTVGVVGRLIDTGNFYHARLQGRNLEIYKWDNNKATLLASEPVAYQNGSSWTISMTFNGNRITAALTDSQNLQVKEVAATDSSHATGPGGVRVQPGKGNIVEFASLDIQPADTSAASAFSARFIEPSNFSTAKLTRGQIAIHLARYLGLTNGNASGTATYADVRPGHQSYAAVEALREAGITLNGSASAQTFEPEAPVTRANLAVAVADALKLPLNDAPAAPQFTDVQRSHPAFRQIQVLLDKKIGANSLLKGKDQFSPERHLTVGDSLDFFADLIVHPPAVPKKIVQ